jgi:hypothetical protein
MVIEEMESIDGAKKLSGTIDGMFRERSTDIS